MKALVFAVLAVALAVMRSGSPLAPDAVIYTFGFWAFCGIAGVMAVAVP